MSPAVDYPVHGGAPSHAAVPGAGTRAIPPVRRVPAPAVLRIAAGLCLCVPGMMLVALAVVMLMPGLIVLFWPVFVKDERVKDEVIRRSVTWPTKGGTC